MDAAAECLEWNERGTRILAETTVVEKLRIIVQVNLSEHLRVMTDVQCFACFARSMIHLGQLTQNRQNNVDVDKNQTAEQPRTADSTATPAAVRSKIS